MKASTQTQQSSTNANVPSKSSTPLNNQQTTSRTPQLPTIPLPYIALQQIPLPSTSGNTTQQQGSTPSPTQQFSPFMLAPTIHNVMLPFFYQTALQQMNDPKNLKKIFPTQNQQMDKKQNGNLDKKSPSTPSAEGDISHFSFTQESTQETSSQSSSSNSQQLIKEDSQSKGRKRRSTAKTTQQPANKKRKKTGTRRDKENKGLRHLSMKACEKLQGKGKTTYNEVANELVAEFTDRTQSKKDQLHDEKNIRRRVYDALNVLMALNIISKDKKEIKWRGLPLNYQQEYENLLAQKQLIQEKIARKRQQLNELKRQEQALQKLYKRNSQPEYMNTDESSRVVLPFIIVHTKKQAIIECEMDEQGTEVFFNFNMPFEIHDDNEILRRLNM